MNKKEFKKHIKSNDMTLKEFTEKSTAWIDADVVYFVEYDENGNQIDSDAYIDDDEYANYKVIDYNKGVCVGVLEIQVVKV